jgi:hypothetical protein
MLEELVKYIEAFVELDIKTQVKKDGSDVALYETVVKINGDIINTIPESVDATIFGRHSTLVDNAITARNQVIQEIFQIISGLLKLPLS